MANVRDSDTSLWLHNKLGTSNDSWTSGSICSQLNKEVLRNIKECFPDLQTQVKLKLLLTFFHIPRRLIEEWKKELEDIIDTAGIDSELWVSMLAETMKTLPATGSLNTEIADYEETRPIFTDMVNDLKKLVTKHSDIGMLPLECQYLNKAALSSMVGQQSAPFKHFTLKRKPKSTTLRAELLQKSCDAQSTLKKVSAPTIPLRSRGMPRKMTDTTPLKGIPSRVPSSGFRSPPSLNSQNRPNFSRMPAGRKDGGIKLLEITEQPLGYAAAKKRKRQQELEEQQKKILETQTINNNNNNTISSPTSTATVTTTTTIVTTTTPDYAAGLSATSVYTQPPTPSLVDRPVSPNSYVVTPTCNLSTTTSSSITTLTSSIVNNPITNSNSVLSSVTSTSVSQPNVKISSPLVIDTNGTNQIGSVIFKQEIIEKNENIKHEQLSPPVIVPLPTSAITITSNSLNIPTIPTNVIMSQSSLSKANQDLIQTKMISQENKIIINPNKPQISTIVTRYNVSPSTTSIVKTFKTTQQAPVNIQQNFTSTSSPQQINNILHIPRQTTIKQIPKPQIVQSIQQTIVPQPKILQIKKEPGTMISTSNSNNLSHQNIPPLIPTQPTQHKFNIQNIQNVNIPLNRIQLDSSSASKANIIRILGTSQTSSTTTIPTIVQSSSPMTSTSSIQQQKLGQIVVPPGVNVKGKTIILANTNQLSQKGVIIRSLGPTGNTVYQQIPLSNLMSSGPPGLVKTESVIQNQQHKSQQIPALVPTSQFQNIPSLTPVMISSNMQQQATTTIPSLLSTNQQKTAVVRPVQIPNVQNVNVLPQGLTFIQRPGQQPQLVQVTNQPIQRTIITQQDHQHLKQQQQQQQTQQTIIVPQQIQSDLTNQTQINRKGLTVPFQYYYEAQEMFRNANAVTRLDKALILGFMAGYRENPKPTPENTIVIKLADAKEKILRENGAYVLTSVESFIKLDYNTGEWKTFKETTILEQHHEESNSVDNSVIIN